MPDQFSLFDDDLQPAAPPTAPAVDAEAPGPAAVPVQLPEAATPAPIQLTPEEKTARLEELRQAALGCTRCGLSASRTNVVFGEGNAAAPLVFVGEGPGENEDATGRPFVGRAGKLLDEVLRRNGMNRNHVFICNVLKCRASELQNGRRLNRPPTAEEAGACQPWLQEQMDVIKPLVVVCLGAPAANMVIHKGFRMTSERGRWFTTSGYAPWAMAAFHPAYVLRLDGPAYEAALDTLVQDIASARQKVIEVKRELKAASTPPARSLFD